MWGCHGKFPSSCLAFSALLWEGRVLPWHFPSPSSSPASQGGHFPVYVTANLTEKWRCSRFPPPSSLSSFPISSLIPFPLSSLQVLVIVIYLNKSILLEPKISLNYNLWLHIRSHRKDTEFNHQPGRALLIICIYFSQKATFEFHVSKFPMMGVSQAKFLSSVTVRKPLFQTATDSHRFLKAIIIFEIILFGHWVLWWQKLHEAERTVPELTAGKVKYNSGQRGKFQVSLEPRKLLQSRNGKDKAGRLCSPEEGAKSPLMGLPRGSGRR